MKIIDSVDNGKEQTVRFVKAENGYIVILNNEKKYIFDNDAQLRAALEQQLTPTV